ncbi:hypothetical protein K1T59_24460, partial [Salmonella enterica]|nr:hypothetical protein [Salmonella enterica]
QTPIMKSLAVALCLVLLVAMASATFGGFGGYGGYEGNNIDNNQYPRQVANINQQQSNKQRGDQDIFNRRFYDNKIRYA